MNISNLFTLVLTYTTLRSSSDGRAFRWNKSSLSSTGQAGATLNHLRARLHKKQAKFIRLTIVAMVNGS
jgi:hypothetical protein